jgi:hypothetical protein
VPTRHRWFVESERLPAGGYLSPGKTGHYDVTREAAEQFGFSPAATAILADAAQDPDFYEFTRPAAHAQTPDEVDRLPEADRSAAIDAAVAAYHAWIRDCFARAKATAAEDPRLALYWVGYVLHAIEDLAPHAGRTNGEHAAGPNPDVDPEAVALASTYTYRALRAMRDGLGADVFDSLRRWDGEGALSFFEKIAKPVHGHVWDLPGAFRAYEESGDAWKKLGVPRIRWQRDTVISAVVDDLAGPAEARQAPADPEVPTKAQPVAARSGAQAAGGAAIAASDDGFVPLSPRTPDRPKAKWTVMVYMAGDDTSPNGIEYAIDQDLRELKKVGSSDGAHLLAQADDAHSPEGYRYRLRSGTPLVADRVESYRGDLNTGRVSTLVDFVRWAKSYYPAERYALVLWGHGSGHDDEDVYRLVRGKVSPRVAAQLARQRLGFFQRTRRTLVELGATRGYGYDDTSSDFLDSRELQEALAQVRRLLGAPLDLLGFDACLMSMVEVAFQIRESARILVASERTEPGDGWPYDRALAALAGTAGPAKANAAALAGDIVSAFGDCYRGSMTLAAVDLARVQDLAAALRGVAKHVDAPAYDLARRSATNCSPRGADGYRDLGSFLDALAGAHTRRASPLATAARRARQALDRAVLRAVGGTGLTVYAPSDFDPQIAGGADALYEQLDFAREMGWSAMLGRVFPRIVRLERAVPAPARAPNGSLHGLDRHNAREVLERFLLETTGEAPDRGRRGAPRTGVGRNGLARKGRDAGYAAAVAASSELRWSDALRYELLAPMRPAAYAALQKLPPRLTPEEAARAARAATRSARSKGKGAEPETVRVYLLPGIMGSLLTDARGILRLVWIDPWGLTVGRDFEGLKLDPTGLHDADESTDIRASALLPVVYERLSLALLAEFGPVVEHVPCDWRRSILAQGEELAARIARARRENPRLRVAVVAHSMGGLVGAAAYRKLAGGADAALPWWLGMVALGTPWCGSLEAVLALRGENDLLHKFAKLTSRSPAQVMDVAQTLWGLCGLLPPHMPSLLDPSLYAPGPLARSGAAALGEALRIVRDPPPNTVAVVSDRQPTLVELAPKDGVIERRFGAGDGTVPLWSSTTSGSGAALPVRYVDQPHALLPLDGAAVRHALELVGQWITGAPYAPETPAPPQAPIVHRTERDGELLDHLGNPSSVTLGDVLALMPLAGCTELG